MILKGRSEGYTEEEVARIMHSNEIHFQCSTSFEVFMRNPIIFKQLYARHFTNAVYSSHTAVLQGNYYSISKPQNRKHIKLTMVARQVSTKVGICPSRLPKDPALVH